MKAVKTFFRLGLTIIACLVMVVAQGLAGTQKLIDPIQEIGRSFPDTIKVTTNVKKSIEFCPDNTCDLFVAKKEVSLDTLKDFAYLYIYFFSDYYVLDDWRKSEIPTLTAKKILLKPDYQRCKSDNEKKKAGCLLRYLTRKSQIELYTVRYDENKRIVDKIDINSLIGP